MGWRRMGAGLLVFVLVLVAVAVLWGRQVWNAALQDNGIEQLDWQGLELSLTGVGFDQISMTQITPERDIVARVAGLTVVWRWRGMKPQITTVTARELDLDWQDTAGEIPMTGEASSPSLFDLMPEELPGWLPQTFEVQRFHALLPCASGRCPLDGALSLAATDSGLPATASLQLQHEGHQLNLLAVLDGSWADDLKLTAELTLDGRSHLTVETDYSAKRTDDLLSWNGSVEVPALPQVDWLLAWLQTWQSVPLDALPAQPETGSISARWQLQGPAGEGFFDRMSGTIAADAQVPQPWPAPGLGTVSGDVSVSLQVDEGEWSPQVLRADVQLSKPAAWAQALPDHLRPKTLALSLRPGKKLTNNHSTQTLLPLQLELTSQGGANVALSSHFAAATSAPWMVQLGETHISGKLSKLAVGEWSLSDGKARLALAGWADTSAAELSFGESTSAEAGQVKGPAAAEVQLNNIKAELAGAKLVARYSVDQRTLDSLSIKGPLVLAAKSVRQPQVQIHPWRFRGSVQGDLNRLKLSGVLRAAETPVNVNLTYPYQGEMQLEGDMRVSGQQEAEALSRVLANWPELLSVEGGNVSASGTYAQPVAGAPTLAAKLVFEDLSGTYDRTAWTRMNGPVEFGLRANRVSVSTAGLTVDEVNPGIPVGPLTVAGRYQASLGQLDAGQLTLEQATSVALGGNVEIKPDSWDLANSPITVPVVLSRLSLAQLLKVYPAEGFSGTGILSGTVPLQFDPATGIQVRRGRVDALEPGGRLQLSAERLRALTSGNETMRMVAQALQDFRYSIMGSGIDYDEDGKLVLRLHLEGSSPEVEGGHPLVLNINLEENIPALLTSLQLSGRVSDAVVERVKKLLNRRERKPADLIE